MVKINETATNAMGTSSSSSGPIQTVDPLMLARPLKRKNLLDGIKSKFGKK